MALVHSFKFHSLFTTRLEIYSFEDQKKDKSSGFLAGLKNKRDKKHLQPQSQSPERHEEIINTIRVQMQVSYYVSKLFHAT